MSGTAILSEIIQILVGGIQGIAEGVGTGLSTLAQNVFLQTVGTGAEATTTLSVFGILVCCFGGIALAIGLCKFIVNWLTSWGN